MITFNGYKDFDSARAATRIYYQACTDPSKAYIALRTVADMLAASSALEHEREAMKIWIGALPRRAPG